MAICKKCGAVLKDGVSFCTACGEQNFEQFINSDVESVNTVQDVPEAFTQPSEQQPISAQAASQQPGTPPQWMLDQKSAPVKKKASKAKKVIIIAACAVLVVGVGGIFVGKTFFARDAMQLFMGENKYMQTVEQTATNYLTDQSIKGLDDMMQAFPTKSANQATDFQSSLNIDLDSNLSNQLNQLTGGNEKPIKDILDYLNGLSIRGSTNQNGQAMQTNFSVVHKSNNLLSCNMFMNKDGKYYLQFPELSKTYLTMGNKDSAKNPYALVSNIKYDSTKLKASLRAITQVYVDAVPNAKVAVQKDQTLTIDAVRVNAEKISVTFTQEQCQQILKKMMETAKKDEYLYTVISDNYSTLTNGAEKMTMAQYEKTFDDGIASLDSSENSTGVLTVSAYITANNTQVGRSYEISGKGDLNKSSLNLIFTKNNNLDKMAANVLVGGKEYACASIVYTAADKGAVQFSIKDADRNMDVGAKIDFSNLKKVKFLNRDITVGTYDISIIDPENFIGNAIEENSRGQNTFFKDIAKSTMNITTSLDNNKLSSKFSLDLNGIAKIAVNGTTTAKTSSEVTIPTVKDSEAIELNSNNDSQNQELQAAYSRSAMKYLFSLPDKDKDLAALLQTFGVTKDILSRYQQQFITE